MSKSDISASLTRANFSEQLRERGFARATAEDLKGHISAVESKLMGFDLFGPDLETLLDGNKKLRKLLKKHRAREHAHLTMQLSEGNEWLAGELSAGESPRPVVVHLPEAFPFAPPEVFPRSGVPRSWHRNRDGSMCLYPSEDRGGLPWLDPDSFLELVERWFSESEAGWPGDFPLLDIEAYIPRSSAEHRLLLYGDLDGLTWVKFQVADFVITLDGAGQHSPGSPKWTKSTIRYGYVADMGTLAEPPQDWGDLATLMGEVAEPVRKAILALEVSILTRPISARWPDGRLGATCQSGC